MKAIWKHCEIIGGRYSTDKASISACTKYSSRDLGLYVRYDATRHAFSGDLSSGSHYKAYIA